MLSTALAAEDIPEPPTSCAAVPWFPSPCMANSPASNPASTSICPADTPRALARRFSGVLVTIERGLTNASTWISIHRGPTQQGNTGFGSQARAHQRDMKSNVQLSRPPVAESSGLG